MTPALLAALVAGAVTLVAVLVAAAAVAVGHRRTQRALAASRAEVAALQARLEQLESTRHLTSPTVAPARYVITTAGAPLERETGTELQRRGPAVADRVVLSDTLGEPLVRLVSVLYGVRQALSAESRNRIGFQMRREVKRARRQRRRQTRQARRALLAGRRSEVAEDDAA